MLRMGRPSRIACWLGMQVFSISLVGLGIDVVRHRLTDNGPIACGTLGPGLA